MTFNEKIDKFMLENNIANLKQLAKLTDIPYTTLRDFYDKQSADNSRLSTIRKLSKYMNCSMDYLSFDEIDDFKGSLKFDNAIPYELPKRIVKIPVLGKIPAGMPLEAIENTYTVDTVDIPAEWLKGDNHYFALKLEGDSMEPDYLDKDIVIFKQTSDCESGQDCCIRINGFDATFKRVRKQENGIMIIPLNENNSTGFVSTFYSKEDIENMPIEILGIVKQIRRNKN